jgi:hypothetical protein
VRPKSFPAHFPDGANFGKGLDGFGTNRSSRFVEENVEFLVNWLVKDGRDAAPRRPDGALRRPYLSRAADNLFLTASRPTAEPAESNYQLRMRLPSVRKMPWKFISSACALVALASASFCETMPSLTSWKSD